MKACPPSAARSPTATVSIWPWPSPREDISATPYLVKDPLASAQRLAPLLGQSQATVLQRLSEHSGFVYLARALPAKQAQASWL